MASSPGPLTKTPVPATSRTLPRAGSFVRERRLQALADRHGVSLGVLEPGGLRTATGGDAVDHGAAGHVVLFKPHAPRLQCGHFRLDVVDRPERLTGLGCARV